MITPAGREQEPEGELRLQRLIDDVSFSAEAILCQTKRK